MAKMRVLDLNSGLGGRIYAFEKAGFEIVAAIDNDVENCEIMTAWMEKEKILNYNLLEVDPDVLPDAEIITAKYIQHQSYESGRMRYDIPENENMAILDIISKKNPIAFLLEVPVSSITSKRQNLEEYIHRFYEIGYSVSYVIYDEMSFSGYPMVGRQGYIVGCRISHNTEFVFPKAMYVSPERELLLESPEKIYPWYRKLNFPTSDWKRGCLYLRTRGILSEKFDKNIVALMGVNGSGKSTILHALACSYSPYEKGEDYKFSYFFTPNPDASWKGSCFTVVNYDLNEKKEVPKKFEKKGDRWVRYASRPQRDVYFMGISSCIPEIELEKKTSFINYVSKTLSDKLNEKIIIAASYILNKDYEELLLHEAGRKKYMGVHTKGGIVYSALSMGAGEQRVIKILQTVYSANQYSLVLIDEIDLLLHAEALHRLIKRLAEIATKKNLQIIFTTHSLEMQFLNQYADIRYIEQQNDRMLVYDSIKPDLLYKMSGKMKREYSIYVEDSFAEAIVQQIAINLGMQRHISIITYGSIENAFVVAAGKVLSEENTENVLVVTDGDCFVTSEEKEKRLKNVLTGTEEGHNEKIQKALKMIVQFNLPENTAPEKYIHSLLISMDDLHECVACAKNITSVDDKHEWIERIVEQIGIGEQIYGTIMGIVSEHECWESYVSSVYEWIKRKKDEIELVCIDE